MYKKLLSHTVLYAVSPQIPAIANLLLLPVITKYLSSSDYGIYGTIMAYMFGLRVFHALGLIAVCNVSFFKVSKFEWVWRQLLGFLLVWGVFYASILAVVLYWALHDIIPDQVFEVIALVITPILFFDIVNGMGYRFLQLGKKPLIISITSIVSGLSASFVTWYTIAVLQLGFRGWLISNLTLSAVMFVFYGYVLLYNSKITPIIPFRFKYMKKHLKFGIPLIPSAYGTFLLTNSDRVVMDLLTVDIKKMGFYNIAYSIGNAFHHLTTGVGLALKPFHYEMLKENTKSAWNNVRSTTFIVQGFFIISTSIVSLWLKEIFQIMVSNDELKLAYPIAILIVMSANNAGFKFTFNNIMIYSERTKLIWQVNLAAGITNVILNFIFIPIYGVMAAAVTTFISLMILGFVGYAHPTFKKLKKQNYYTIIWVVIICLCTVAVYEFRDIDILLKAVITIIALIVTGVIFMTNRKKFLVSS